MIAKLLEALRRAALLLAGAGLIGCAASGPKVLHFGVDEAPEGGRMLWPQPPDIPRYLYAGELVGEGNFHSPADRSRGALGEALAWIAGLGSSNSAPVVLQRPQAGWVDPDGRILVADASRQAVLVFDPAGGALHVWEQADSARRFVNPVGIGRAIDGSVLVADAGLAVVLRLAPDGVPRGSFGRGLLKRPTGLAVDPVSGRVFVADTHGHDVKVFDRDGVLLATWGRRGEGLGEFNFPTHLTWAQGELYVTDTLNNRIQILDGVSGEARRSLGERGLTVGNLVRPKGVAVDSQRNVYVVESYYDHLLVFDRLGRFLMGFGGVGKGSGRFYLPSGVWIDSRDRVFIADTFNGRVAVFQFLGGGADGEL